MKRAIFAVLLCYAATATASLEPIYMSRPTYSQLQANADTYHDTHVGMMGVLSLNADGRVYLCESLDVCLSWNPNKLEVNRVALKESLGKNYKRLDRCHVHVSGTYIRDEVNDFGIRIGLLSGSLIRVQLSISREDYAEFNPHCDVWNQAVETSKKPGNENMLSEIIDRMKYTVM
ncbi:MULTISPECIES: hypothetical protein [Alkalimonas]|uniref:Uncharacterized protein n=1 Tax=Alkalimonas mucilaginosa TaxID=3057676 RepID=A0ABU7JKB0_9GAMM|nr:hypothetical protein [Alkalimonas sp. MEB004]MEE2026124.1 hypothetical protein [Alkalimonas sp. MEB004]